LIAFDRFGGNDVRREFMQRLSAALHGTLGSYLRDALFRRAVLTLWHAFMFLGVFPLFFFLLGGLYCFFL
jgi:hypothetical protein